MSGPRRAGRSWTTDSLPETMRQRAEDRRRLMGVIDEHFVNKDFVSWDNRERAIRCSDCSRSEGKIVEMVLIRMEPSGVSG